MGSNEKGFSFADLKEMRRLQAQGQLIIKRTEQGKAELVQKHLGELRALQDMRSNIATSMMSASVQSGKPIPAPGPLFDLAQDMAMEDYRRRLVEACKTLHHLEERVPEELAFACALAGVKPEEHKLEPVPGVEVAKPAAPSLLVVPS